MKSKIFISIDVPEKVKKRLVLAIEKWKDLPVKWTWENKLHLTLIFLGYPNLDLIPEICEKVKKALEKEEMFDLEFTAIEIAPSPDRPQMIWLKGKPSENLLRIYEKLEKALDIFVAPRKTFRPHITLGRIRKFKWEALPERPEIFEKFPLSLSVGSIDVMSSDFEKGEKENKYTLLESCPLK